MLALQAHCLTVVRYMCVCIVTAILAAPLYDGIIPLLDAIMLLIVRLARSITTLATVLRISITPTARDHFISTMVQTATELTWPTTVGAWGATLDHQTIK